MGRPSDRRKKLLTAKIAKTSRRLQSRDLSPAGIEGKYWGVAYLFSIGTYFDG